MIERQGVSRGLIDAKETGLDSRSSVVVACGHSKENTLESHGGLGKTGILKQDQGANV